MQTLLFNDVIGEPDGTHSFDCVWTFSRSCFESWKIFCYNLMTMCCGCCMAAQWGCEFAFIAFWHIWYITPMFKILEINCGVCLRLYSMCINCCMTPVCEAVGGIFHHFKHTWRLRLKRIPKSTPCTGNTWAMLVLSDDIFTSYCHYLFLNAILSLCKAELILSDLIFATFQVSYIYIWIQI